MGPAGTTSPLLHPFFLGSLAVLTVNDHVLKGAWPGPVTGKLSDVAGPVVVAVVLAVVVGDRLVAVGTTAVGFAALKLSPTVAALAAPLLGGVTRTDPTDLIGLLALVPTYWFLGTPTVVGPGSGAPASAGRPSARVGPGDGAAGSGRALRTVGLIAVAAVTTFSVTATSCLEPPRVSAVYTDPAGLVAVIQADDREPDRVHAAYRSVDGGRTWSPIDPAGVLPAGSAPNADEVGPDPRRAPDETAQSQAAADGPPSDAEAPIVDDGAGGETGDPGGDGAGDPADDGADHESSDPAGDGAAEPGGETSDPTSEPAGVAPAGTVTTEACLADGRCFRVEPGEQVLAAVDGRWETAFRFTDEDLARMSLREADCSAGGTTGFFAALAVTDPTAAGTAQTVVVAMGPQGVLRLDPRTGGWDRLAVGDLEPVSTSGPRWLRWLLLTPILVIVASPTLFLVNRRRVSVARRLAAAALGAGAGAILLLLVVGLFLVSFGAFEYQALSLFFAAASVVAFLVSLIVVLPRGRGAAGPRPEPGAGGPPSAVGGRRSPG